MNGQRGAGLVCPITCLSSPYLIGDLGPESYEFARFLHASGCDAWHWQPTVKIGAGNSPYSSLFTRDQEPLLISPDLLREDGLLTNSDLLGAPGYTGKTNYDGARSLKYPLLSKAASRFREGSEFEQFLGEHPLLTESCLFAVLTNSMGPWQKWDAELRDRNPQALTRASASLKEEVREELVFQFFYDTQMKRLLQYLESLGLGITGVTDMPIYPSASGFDAWRFRHLFQLDPNGYPTHVAGVPPDYFSPDGQRWGNALYNIEAMVADDYMWLIDRFRSVLKYGHCCRLDHFRALEKFWSILASTPGAKTGKWLKGLGEPFLLALEKALGRPLSEVILAEDLGKITKGVADLRDRFKLRGMVVGHFGLNKDTKGNPHYLHNHTKNSVAYSCTHDNSGSSDWLANLSEEEKQIALTYLVDITGGIHRALTRWAWSSPANDAAAPVWDIVGCPDSFPQNKPGTAKNNWEYMLPPGALTPYMSAWLYELGSTYGRLPPKPSTGNEPEPEPDPYDPDFEG